MNTNFRNIEKKITADGWILVRISGSHYQYKKVGSLLTVVIPNYNGKDLSIGIINNLKKVTGLSLTR